MVQVVFGNDKLRVDRFTGGACVPEIVATGGWPNGSHEEIRGLLGQMLFPRDDANKKTEVLSGGEAARLIFCKLMLQKPNVLVLDEPTNHKLYCWTNLRTTWIWIRSTH